MGKYISRRILDIFYERCMDRSTKSYSEMTKVIKEQYGTTVKKLNHWELVG